MFTKLEAQGDWSRLKRFTLIGQFEPSLNPRGMFPGLAFLFGFQEFGVGILDSHRASGGCLRWPSGHRVDALDDHLVIGWMLFFRAVVFLSF